MREASKSRPILVKRYARSRFYDTTNRRYVSVEQLRGWAAEGVPFRTARQATKMSPKKFPAPSCWRVDEATASESMGEQRANHPISVNPKPEPVSDPAGIDRPNSNVASTPTSPRGGTKIANCTRLIRGLIVPLLFRQAF